MDVENVLTLTTDPDRLDQDMIDWQSMTFSMRKKADDACIRKFGITNTDLYNKIKQAIEDSKFLVTEDDALFSVSELEKKIELLNKSQELQGNGEVIIDDWVGDKPNPGYGEYLEKKYNDFQTLSFDMKTRSNNSSMAIWGYDVPNMYQMMKNKWLNYIELSPEDIITKDTLQNYVSESMSIKDPLQLLLRKLDIVTYKGSLYEAAGMEKINTYIDNVSNSMVDYSEDIPQITPWFTPDEMEDITATDVDPYDYVLQQDIKSYHEKLKEASLKGDKETLLKLGWNPSVKYTPESAKYARERQIKWFNENKQIQIIDLSKYEVVEEATKKKVNPIIQLEPIYITNCAYDGLVSNVIKGYTGSRWSHAGIAFDHKLDKIYSFNGKTPDGRMGFSIENLKYYQKEKNPKLKVMTVFVYPEVKQKMETIIHMYEFNKEKTKYDFADLFRILLNKSKDTQYSMSMICSQFTDSIFKAVNIDLTGKPSNLVMPGDFEANRTFSKIFTLYDGDAMKYKANQVKNKVNRLISSSLSVEDIITKPLKEALRMMLDNPNVKAIVEQIENLLTPTSYIYEAKNLPVRFGKSGNLFVELPRNLEREYQEAHRLLDSYNETNLEGIKHQVARLFYINTIIEKRIDKMKKNDPEYKELIDLRARVLNDYKKYMKIIQKDNKNFDMEEYMKNSEYYDKTIMVDKHTMKFTGKAIKDMMKIMV